MAYAGDLKSQQPSPQLSAPTRTKAETACIDTGYVNPFPRSPAHVRSELQNQVTPELTPLTA
jgi:hypothetical protein